MTLQPCSDGTPFHTAAAQQGVAQQGAAHLQRCLAVRRQRANRRLGLGQWQARRGRHVACAFRAGQGEAVDTGPSRPRRGSRCGRHDVPRPVPSTAHERAGGSSRAAGGIQPSRAHRASRGRPGPRWLARRAPEPPASAWRSAPRPCRAPRPAATPPGPLGWLRPLVGAGAVATAVAGDLVKPARAAAAATTSSEPDAED